MTGYSKTLLSLMVSGFERRTSQFDLPTVGYQFQYLDLEASDVVNKYQQPVVQLGGVLDTGRVRALIEGHIPRDLDCPEAATAWVSYALKSCRHDLEPLPAWFLTGERHWDLIPRVRRQRLFEKRPRCSIERDHARLLRKQLAAALDGCGGDVIVSFDGQILRMSPGEHEICALARGDAWPMRYRITFASPSQLPARFMRETVEVSFFEGRLTFGNHVYDAQEVLV